MNKIKGVSLSDIIQDIISDVISIIMDHLPIVIENIIADSAESGSGKNQP